MGQKKEVLEENEEDGLSQPWTCLQKSRGRESTEGLKKRQEAVRLGHRVKGRADGAE